MDFDVIVVGSGPGGYVTAIRASQLGLKTAVVEKENLGGVCLNWGCIPTKALLKSAQVFEYVKHAEDFGINIKEYDKDFSAVVKRSREVANGMSSGVQFLMKKNKITVLDGYGTVKPGKKVAVAAADGKETKDMTRAQIVKATFRVLTLKLGKAKVPMVVTNHTYDVVGSMFPTKEMGGGSGLKYAASSIVYLSKKKEKDGTEVVGNIIHCKNAKSRLTIENKMVDVRLMYERGLDRYYGLLELALKYGIFKSVSTRIELPDGSKTFGKTINNDPKKFFTDEIMEQLDKAANQEFKYGNQKELEAEEEVLEDAGE